MKEYKSGLAERLALAYQQFIEVSEVNRAFLENKDQLLKEFSFTLTQVGAEIEGYNLDYSRRCLKSSKELIKKLKQIKKEFEFNINIDNFQVSIESVNSAVRMVQHIRQFIPTELGLDYVFIMSKVSNYIGVLSLLRTRPKNKQQIDYQLALLLILINKVESLKALFEMASNIFNEIFKKIKQARELCDKIKANKRDRNSLQKCIKVVGEVLELFHELEKFANSHYESIYSGLPEVNY
ncbi:MAG: hypothetical protein EPN86_03090 [Nanoarchaeota archaeon]|nr:MAG: hypothetical protein EPN86_03090 [Nanoarchaeota archaeon]